jgi:hypothetical protein
LPFLVPLDLHHADADALAVDPADTITRPVGERIGIGLLGECFLNHVVGVG